MFHSPGFAFICLYFNCLYLLTNSMNYFAATFAGILCRLQLLSSFTLFSCSLNSNLSGFGNIRDKRKFRKSLQLFKKPISIMSLFLIFVQFMYRSEHIVLGILKIFVYLLCKYLLFLFYFFVSCLWLSQDKLF